MDMDGNTSTAMRPPDCCSTRSAQGWMNLAWVADFGLRK